MMKMDEWQLVVMALENGGRLPDKKQDELSKREYRLLEKWTGRDHWDYGVSLRTGWMTKEGVEYFRGLAQQQVEKELRCNETFHRLGGIDDCDGCKVRQSVGVKE